MLFEKSKIMIVFLIALALSSFTTVALVSTEAKADNCPCWVASWDSGTEICTYYFCLPGFGPYHVRVTDPSTLKISWMHLSYDDHDICDAPCHCWRGWIHWPDYDPSTYLWWAVFEGEFDENIENMTYIGDHTSIPPCEP
jgi:hypothetical protein